MSKGYLISLAQQATSIDRLKQTLLSDDWLPPSDHKTHPFIQKLCKEFAAAAQVRMQTVAGDGAEQRRQKDSEKINQLKTLSNYKILSDEDIVGGEEEESLLYVRERVLCLELEPGQSKILLPNAKQVIGFQNNSK